MKMSWIWPDALYSTTLGRPPFFAITPTFSSGEAFQTLGGVNEETATVWIPLMSTKACKGLAQELWRFKPGVQTHLFPQSAFFDRQYLSHICIPNSTPREVHIAHHLFAVLSLTAQIWSWPRHEFACWFQPFWRSSSGLLPTVTGCSIFAFWETLPDKTRICWSAKRIVNWENMEALHLAEEALEADLHPLRSTVHPAQGSDPSGEEFVQTARLL